MELLSSHLYFLLLRQDWGRRWDWDCSWDEVEDRGLDGECGQLFEG